MSRALCKLRGTLAIVELTPTEGEGKCPLCNGTQFINDCGWVTCNTCFDYAILESNLKNPGPHEFEGDGI